MQDRIKSLSEPGPAGQAGPEETSPGVAISSTRLRPPPVSGPVPPPADLLDSVQVILTRPRPRGRPRKIKPATAAFTTTTTATQSAVAASKGIYTDDSGQQHQVKVILQKDKFDEGSSYVTIFITIAEVFRRHRLSGDARLVFDWLTEHIAYRRRNLVLDVTCARVAREAIAPVVISAARASVLLGQLESSGLILRSRERTSRATVFINPHYCILGNAQDQREAVLEWDGMVAARRRREIEVVERCRLQA